MSVTALARSHSDDPAQETLRKRKDSFNQHVREYIARLNQSKPHLIAFKRALNGIGDLKAGLPSSKIQEPFASAVGSYLHGIHSEFEELSHMFASIMAEANAIVEEQAQYSLHRRRGKKKAGLEPETSALIVEASNFLTRFWAGLRADNTALSDYRISMLALTVELYTDLKELEHKVVERGSSNLMEVLDGYFIIAKKVQALNISYRHIQKIREMADKSPPSDKELAPTNSPKDQKPSNDALPPPSGKSPPLVPPPAQVLVPSTADVVFNISYETSVKELINNLYAMLACGVGFKQSDISACLSNCIHYLDRKSTLTEKHQEMTEDHLRTSYEEILSKFRKIVEKVTGASAPEFLTKNYIKNLVKKAQITDQLVILAGRDLSDQWKSFINHRVRKDPTSASRLVILKLLGKMKEEIKSLMKLLEKKSADFISIDTKITAINLATTQIFQATRLLSALYSASRDKIKQLAPERDKRYFSRQIRHNIEQIGW